MKNALNTLFYVCISFFCFAQDEPSSVLKVNLTSLVLNTYSLQYEKALSDRFSFALGASYRPEKRIPFASTVERYIDAADRRIDYISLENVKKGESTIGLFHITPELRFYMGKKRGAPIGTYLSVFGKYENYHGTAPVFVDMFYKGTLARVELPVDTKINTYSGGLMIGKQFRLGERFTFDWFIFGGHMGSIKVHGESIQDLEGYGDEFIDELRTKIVDTFKINENYISLDVNQQGVNINNARNLKYFNLRGFGFNLGYRF